jgi:putative nucleotidyltransferase with HDIG domain
MLERIDIDSLQEGMFIEDVYDRHGRLLLSTHSLVDSREKIRQLKARGIASVCINTERATGAALNAEHDTTPSRQERIREQAYFSELETAREIRAATLRKATDALKAIRAGKRFSLRDIESSAEDIVASLERNPDALVSLCQIKGYDEYTYVHSVNVGVLVSSLAQSMGYSSEHLLHATIGGLLHDIGKMRIPEHVLNKPGKLTDAEFALMKRHPVYGLDILTDRTSIAPLARQIVGQHHERFNGQGYPKGLRCDDITEMGVISAIADVYDALTSDRVYKQAWTPQKALAVIFQGADKDYARRIVELFTRHLGIYPVGSFVRLQSGELGVVVRVDKGRLLAPRVIVLFDQNAVRLTSPRVYDLRRKVREPDGTRYAIACSLDPRPFGVVPGEYLQRAHRAADTA